MRTRNYRIEFCLTADELKTLNSKACKARMSKGAFIRAAIDGKKLNEAPPREYYELLREVKKSGSEIDRLLKLADAGEIPEAGAIRKALENNLAAERLLWTAFASKA